MKLYCWRAKSYAQEAFVVADSEESARAALEATRVLMPTEPKPSREEMAAKHDLWGQWFNYGYHNRMLDAVLYDRSEYDLVVLEPGQVAWAEKS